MSKVKASLKENNSTNSDICSRPIIFHSVNYLLILGLRQHYFQSLKAFIFQWENCIFLTYLTPLNPLSVRLFILPSVRQNHLGARRAFQPSTGAKKKPPIGGMDFLVIMNLKLKRKNLYQLLLPMAHRLWVGFPRTGYWLFRVTLKKKLLDRCGKT